MDSKQFLRENKFFNDNYIYNSEDEKFELSELLTKYAQSLQLRQSAVMRCSSKEIDRFFKETMYTDLTNYYGIIQRVKKGNYVKWRSPSEMIKDFFKWRNNNA
jgi:hypothetical protein